jgi:hypothetical protein
MAYTNDMHAGQVVFALAKMPAKAIVACFDSYYNICCIKTYFNSIAEGFIK